MQYIVNSNSVAEKGSEPAIAIFTSVTTKKIVGDKEQYKTSSFV